MASKSTNSTAQKELCSSTYSSSNDTLCSKSSANHTKTPHGPVTTLDNSQYQDTQRTTRSRHYRQIALQFHQLR